MNTKRIRRIVDGAKELRQEVMGMGLDPSGKSVKELQMIIAMGRFAESNPGEEFPDQFDPMLAKDSSKADSDWIDDVYNSEDWIIQEKMNGMRSILSISGDGKVRMTSRSKSKKNFMFVPHEQNVLGFIDLKSPFKGKVVLDGELMAPKSRIDTGSTITESPLQSVVALVHMNTPDSLKIQQEVGSLQYHAFDILFFEGEDVQDLPYEERDVLVATAVEMLKHENTDLPIKAVETIKSYDSAFKIYKQFVEEGKEGIMLKSRKGKYRQGARSGDLQKLKGFVTVDGFITGFVPSSKGKGFEDQIGGFKISSYVDGKVTEVASVSNIPNDIRKDATILKDGVPSLNPEYLNKCVELVGQEISAKSNRLGSARINEWRPDKDPEDCQLDSELFKGKQWK